MRWHRKPFVAGTFSTRAARIIDHYQFEWQLENENNGAALTLDRGKRILATIARELTALRADLEPDDKSLRAAIEDFVRVQRRMQDTEVYVGEAAVWNEFWSSGTALIERFLELASEGSID